MVDMVPRDDVAHAAGPARFLDTSPAIAATLKGADVNNIITQFSSGVKKNNTLCGKV